MKGKRVPLAIVLTDIVGYTALCQENENLALRLLAIHNDHLKAVFDTHRGRVVNTIGDAFLVTFEDPNDAVHAAVEAQRALREWKLQEDEGRRISIRIGIHFGRVVVRKDGTFGDAVNTVSRIEPIAEPGGICLSKALYEEIRKDIALPVVYLGKRVVKNIKQPLSLYKIALPWDEGEIGRR